MFCELKSEQDTIKHQKQIKHSNYIVCNPACVNPASGYLQYFSVNPKANKIVCVPRSSAIRNSRLRCNSFMNSSFCRKSAMRSSSRYCFSLRSCSEAPDAPGTDAEQPGTDAEEECGSGSVPLELYSQNTQK